MMENIGKQGDWEDRRTSLNISFQPEVLLLRDLPAPHHRIAYRRRSQAGEPGEVRHGCPEFTGCHIAEQAPCLDLR